ncbi:DotU family type IV/VI secretion system protein [Escherichia coli]
MIDAATPLLGMVMRLSTMNSQTMPEHLFAQVVTDVQAVEQLLQEQGYEPGCDYLVSLHPLHVY